MRDTFTFGSRALNLTPEQRKKMASEMRWVRSLRKYVGLPSSKQTMEQRKANEREYLASLFEIVKNPPPPPPPASAVPPASRHEVEQPWEREERLREQRRDEREAHSQRALRDLDAIKMRGPY